jgi:hypothetical protein
MIGVGKLDLPMACSASGFQVREHGGDDAKHAMNCVHRYRGRCNQLRLGDTA